MIGKLLDIFEGLYGSYRPAMRSLITAKLNEVNLQARTTTLLVDRITDTFDGRFGPPGWALLRKELLDIQQRVKAETRQLNAPPPTEEEDRRVREDLEKLFKKLGGRPSHAEDEIGRAKGREEREAAQKALLAEQRERLAHEG